ncbi:Lysine exporter LysO [bioreactor metagenome]|uniref:Lysine exporter LysO n=1 Tax=bioreactor metagenome TaxID=1076179 RepID=A0A645GWW8_9ZZZZ
MLKELGGEALGAIAFLTNVFREIFAVILIPILAKRLNTYSAIAPAGATSMDTTLPLVSKATNPEVAVISFINGVIMSSLVPVLVTFFYNIK